RLAGAVWSDNRAQFAFLDDKGEVVERLEAVKADRDAVDVEQYVRRRRHGDGSHQACSFAGSGTGSGSAGGARRGQRSPRSMPAIPVGKTSVVSTKSPPRMNSQISGAALVSQVLARLARTAPMIAPLSVPRPPTETQTAISIELPGENSLGLMMP